MAYESPYSTYGNEPMQRVPKSTPYAQPPSPPEGQRNAWNAPAFNIQPGWYPNEDEFRLRLYQQLGNFQNAGYFDPRGNQTLIEAGRMNAGRISGALQRRRSLAAQSMGLNPTQRASYELQSMLQGSGDEANLYNEALMDAWRRQADYAQQLNLGQYGLAPEYHKPEEPGFWDYAAGIGGQAAGAYVGKKA